MHTDFIEFVEELHKHKVDYVITEGMALAFYGYPRYTGDLDVWTKPTLDNTKRLFDAIEEFFGTSVRAVPEDFISGHKIKVASGTPARQRRRKASRNFRLQIHSARYNRTIA